MFHRLNYMIDPLLKCFEEDLRRPWVQLEEQIISPHTFKDVLFSGFSPKYCSAHFGPVITRSISARKHPEKSAQCETKWLIDPPIFNNNIDQTGGELIQFPQWQRRYLQQ